MAQNLVLLPGMDGTGDLFDDFVAALPQGVAVRVGRYPTREFLNYSQLFEFVRELTADLDRFAVLGESFSSPLAIMLAAAQPCHVSALIICAGFASNPFPVLGPLMQAVARPWLFRLEAPDVLLDHYIFDASAPASLKDKVRQNLRTVSPEVQAGRALEILLCDARKDLAKIKAPTLYLQGSGDRLIKARCFEGIRKVRPDVQLASIPAPHLILQHQPRRSAEIILRFCFSISI